jgi:hypothetical protein
MGVITKPLGSHAPLTIEMFLLLHPDNAEVLIAKKQVGTIFGCFVKIGAKPQPSHPHSVRSLFLQQQTS